MRDADIGRALLLLETPPPAFSLSDAAGAAREHYGLAGHITALAGERDRNFLLRRDGAEALVLKFSNPEEDAAVLAFQIAMMQHIAQERPALAVPRLWPTLAGAALATVHTPAGAPIAMHAITLLPGVSAQGVPSTETMRRNIGRVLGEMALALESFSHPGANRVLLWDIMQVPRLRAVLQTVQDPARRAFIARFLDDFEAELEPRLATLRRQVIHNDLSTSNLMVAAPDDPTVTGVLDFGDAVVAPRINDLAVAASYHLAAGDRPLDAIAGMVEAFEAVTPLQEEELAMLPDLLLARLVVRTIINEWRSARFPENRVYIQRTMHQAWALLDHFMALPDASRRDLAARSFQRRRRP